MNRPDGGGGMEKRLSDSNDEGERKQVTVLFADVAGFTTLSEEMDPEEVSDLIRPCVEMMSEEIHRYGGTIAQFLGDGLMALFGAPTAHEDSPRRAVHAALAIQRRLLEYSEEPSRKSIAFEVRIGLNTGLVVVGSVGEDAAMTYTAIGDTVNLASRMESTAEPGTVKVAEATYLLTQSCFDFEGLGETRVKGKRKPVRAYRPLRPRTDPSRVDEFLRSGFSRFIGRSLELDELVQYFQRAIHGHGQVVTVVGEPGIGKSRLVRELRLSLPEKAYTYLEGGCLHYGEAIAYLPILQVLKDYFELSDGEEEAAAREKIRAKLVSLGACLETAISPLEEVLSLGVDDEAYLLLEPPQRRERVFEAIGDILVAESRRRTLVLVVEDLHWIDRTSEEFLARFVGGIGSVPILLLLLSRPDFTPAWMDDLDTVRLDQLRDKTSSDMVASLLPGAQVSRELDDFIVSRTTGNPLFIEELTHSLLESGHVARDNDRYVLSGEVSELQVPDTVQGIIASRLDRLDRVSKRTIQVASCIGREFSCRLLSIVTSMEDELDEVLSHLKAFEFIYKKSRFPEPEYAFKHALTQDVAYNSLLLKRRREIHERIGYAIEGLYPDRQEESCELLAHHYARSGNAEKAIRYLKLAGNKASKAYSNWEAVAFYGEAKRLLDAQPETDEIQRTKLEICLALQDPLALQNYPEGSLELLQEAEKLAGEIGDTESLAHIFRKSSRYYAVKGNSARAIEYSEKSLDLAQKTGDVESMAKVAFDVCNARFVAGDLVGAAGITRSALGLLEEKKRETDLYYSGDWTAFSALSGCRGLALAGLGEFDGGEGALAKGLAIALESKDLLGEAWIEYCRLTLYFYKGDAGNLVEEAKMVIGHFEEIGAEFVLGMCWSYLACGRYFSGNMREARECAEKGAEMGRTTGLPTNLPLSLVALSLAESGSQDHEAAEKTAGEALELSRVYKTLQFEAYALFMLGTAVAHARPSDTDAAERHIGRGIRIAREQHRKPSICHGLIFLGEVLALGGRRDEAIENLRDAESLCVEMGMGYWLSRAREALAELAGD